MSDKAAEDSESATTTSSEAPAGSAPAPDQGWTLIFLCVGIAVIAACVLIPETDETQRLVYQCERLKGDLGHLEKQIAANKAFIDRVGTDPALAERLAQRQLKYIRKDTRVLELKGQQQGGGGDPSSPMAIALVPPPKEPPAVRPTGGKFAELCRAGKSRLYMIGGGLMLLAMGLVLGAARPTRD